MKITIVGSGYVGLVTGTCFAEVGIEVSCVDVDKNKIEGLKKGIIPIYEPGLQPMVERNAGKGRLHFTTDLASTLEGCKVVFIAVGTPPGEDGSADLQYVLDVAREVGRNMKEYILLVTKSTVPVGTAEKVRSAVKEELDRRKANIDFDVASNPEFLKEGAAIEDFLKPDRIVIGTESEKAMEIMQKLYKPFTLNGHPLIFMDIPSAEMTKYAANAMLATRISFMNEVANLCEIMGANVDMVRKGIGSDPRIGNKFIYPGTGYGGSCFPKDVKALIRTAKENNYTMELLQAVESVNDRQKEVLYHKAMAYFKGEMKGKKIAMWGLSFKPQTDDMREAPSRTLVKLFLEAGCTITAYDPIAMDEARKIFGDKVAFADDMYDVLDDADCLLLVTEWKEFRVPDLQKMKELMKQQVVFDGRNIYDGKDMRNNGFDYFAIGK
ncbi:MAG: UDP-glucose/GDP-mannose dehydrogenase family protein [Bacteroidales bacterium]|jgi:UDPglucose 6-dehydrogenase|nr:UDP-glucose/GDP-mannose dehydrogenase family protein [Bacteroidales bacterium]